jgi:site-specific recombinase XerD
MNKEVELTFTIDIVITKYLDAIKLNRSEHTIRAYKNGFNSFRRVLAEVLINPQTTSIQKLTEDAVLPFVISLNDLAPATEKLYLHAIKGFYEYVSAERLAEINMFYLFSIIRQRARHSRVRIPKLAVNDIERLLVFIANAQNLQTEHEVNGTLRTFRDRAFLLMLADTGLRVHEACKLRRGDVDWNEGRAVIIGKGDKKAVVRFSTRSMKAIKDYLSLRAQLDGGSGKQLASLPLFARHDKGAGKKIKPITPTTGRNIVAERVGEILGKEAVGKITPHSFRHYFVTTVLRGSGNLKLAQELARHSNIQVTQRYAHLSDDELDKGYYDIFEQKVKK